MSTPEERARRQMMADLGLGRRDDISTAEADHRGREIKKDLGALNAKYQTLQNQHNQRIKAIIKSDSNSPLAAWHAAAAAANSVSDAPDSGLEVRWNGQGHRLNSERERAGHDHQETRYSDERAQYLAQRASRQREQQQNGHQRAPSPRAAGVARWVKGKPVQGAPPSNPRPTIINAVRGNAGRVARQDKLTIPKAAPTPTSSAGIKRAIVQHITRSSASRPLSVRTATPQRVNVPIQPIATATASARMIPAAMASKTDTLAHETKTEKPVETNDNEIVSIRTARSTKTNDGKKHLVFQDILNIDGIKDSSDACSILKMLFHSDRKDWLLQHSNLINQFVAVGNVIRKEMLEVAQHEGDSVRRKSFLAEFGMIPDVTTHLAAARRAINVASGTVDEGSFYDLLTYYKPFLAMAQSMLPSKQQAQVTTKEPVAQDPDSPVEPTYIAVAGRRAASSNGSTVVSESPYIEPRLIALIEKNARAMLSRSGAMVDGVVKRNGIYYLDH